MRSAWRRTWPAFQGISWHWRDAGRVRRRLSEGRGTHELHDEVEFVGGLEGVGEADEEGVVDVFQDHLFGLGVLDLVLLYDVVFIYALHGEQLLAVLLFHQ